MQPMTTAADTNILLDVFIPNSEYTLESGESLRVARQRGRIFVCDVVYAELVPNFTSRANLDTALHTIGATLSPITADIAFDAGLRWGQ